MRRRCAAARPRSGSGRTAGPGCSGRQSCPAAVGASRRSPPERHCFFRDDLRRVEHVEVKAVGELVIEELDAELPGRVITPLDGVPQVAAVEVGVSAVDLDPSFQTTDCRPCAGFQWNFTKVESPAALTNRKV